MQSYEKTYIALNDGRDLCLECLNSAIMDTDECQPLYLRVQEFFEGLNMEVKEEVPLLLVDKEGMKEALDISRGPRLGYGNQMTDIETESYELTKHCEVTGILILYGLPRLLTGQVIAHELMHAWLRLNGT
ncbi:Protein DA1-related 1 [Forsythia ovata]|uniref:Protein DA1-related 1 n=1 Tax=Forsythia ovata TaxID=205694 RepID=A0ABD1RM65_9LAMI